ncbi:hypothetical protein GXW78_16595 [Roseomonas terrae]|uniref:DUF4286 family protein n=1 Tax=Neoroseomonas terrae TaxID=424799 RepID=A0ABS5EJW0_9PROT|nr:hypothetical protein [Neoroseomonas terrae]MBR0651293.1 hypothetical protein [Neoroseomonas terrae]
MSGPVFYVVEIEPAAEALPAFAEWYASVHAPHLFNAGFNNCTSYVGVSGTMAVVDIYQAGDWAMFQQPAFDRYRDIAATDPWRPPAIRGLPNSRTVYHHHPSTPVPSRDAAAPLDADWILIWRFEGDAALEERIAAWLTEGGGATLIDHGARQIRLLHRGRDAPTGPSIRPALSLVTEWAAQPPYGLAATLPGWLSSRIDPALGFAGWRLYPWARDPALRLATAPKRIGTTA